jgi:hypothetical protein
LIRQHDLIDRRSYIRSFVESVERQRKRDEENKGETEGEEERDNLANKGFTARNRSLWKFEFYLVVGALPARSTGL